MQPELIPDTAHILIVESETSEDRDRRRASTGRSSGETYRDLLKTLAPRAACELIRPIQDDAEGRPRSELHDYDAIVLTGSPLHVYRETPEVRQQIEFMRAVFQSSTPSFGSCAGLQIAAAAAGGTVQENRNGHEIAFARRITMTEAGRTHPLMAGRPETFDAPAMHSDEVAQLPAEATLLASNRVTAVQAAEIRWGGGVFWGVQYHPELPLGDIAEAMRRQKDDIIKQGLAADEASLETYASDVEALDRDPSRRDLMWRLGLDEQVTDPALRQSELRNFLRYLVAPTRSRRRRA